MGLSQLSKKKKKIANQRICYLLRNGGGKKQGELMGKNRKEGLGTSTCKGGTNSHSGEPNFPGCEGTGGYSDEYKQGSNGIHHRENDRGGKSG